jgi:cell division protein FtsQ
MKKFWHILKKILALAAVLSCAVLFVVVLTSAIKKQSELLCSNVQVDIDYNSGLSFISEKEIKERLNYLSGENLVGKTLSTIDYKTLETEIEKNPFVDAAEIFVDQKQQVVVQIVQKRPIIRVINNDGVSYYISEKNERMPLHNTFTSHVVVALGNVDLHTGTKRDSTVQAALYTLTQYIRKDEFLDAMVDQIYVNDQNDFDLIPKVGNHVIKFGKVDKRMAEKFNGLKVFYKEGLRNVGWDKYKTINLKFENQVVCEKRDTTNTI